MLPSTTDDFLLDGLSPGDLCRYSRTCRDAQSAVSSYIRRHFNLHKALERYFKPEEVVKFRELQATTGMLISGSTALQFLERTVYPSSDLDLYVEHRYRRPIAWWLKSIGYELRPPVYPPNMSFQQTVEFVRDRQIFLSADQHFIPSEKKGYFGAASILTFEASDPYRKIELITSHHSALGMVLNFHSTCVMNVITHEKAYSLYPRGTFDERRSLICRPPPKVNQHQSINIYLSRKIALAKYASRGWKMVDKITEEESKDPMSAFSGVERQLGDSKCWTLPILPKLDFPDSHVEMNSWALVYDWHLKPRMTFTAFLSSNLRFSYLIVDDLLLKYVSRFIRDLSAQTQGNWEFDGVLAALMVQYREQETLYVDLSSAPDVLNVV